MALYFDETKYDGEYDGSILKIMEEAIESWESESEFDYSDNPCYEMFRDLCKTLVAACSDPENTESVLNKYAKIHKALNEDFNYYGPAFNEFLEYELAKKSIGLIAEGSQNVLGLFATLAQIQRNDIPKIPLDYFKRVLRCYIWGLYPECVVMCRSVIESAIKEKVTDIFCTRYLAPKEPYNLYDKINALDRSGFT